MAGLWAGVYPLTVTLRSWSSNVPSTNGGSSYDMYYTPSLVIDPFLVDVTLLDCQYPPLGDGAADEEGAVAKFVWFVLDEDEPPVKVMKFKPAEHVSVPLIYRIHSIPIRLFGFDPYPTPLDGFLYAGILLLLCFAAANTCYWWHLRQRGRLEEYWRLIDYPPEWFLDLADVVLPEQEEYFL